MTRGRLVVCIVALAGVAATSRPAGPREAYAAYTAALAAGDLPTAKAYALADARHSAFLDGQMAARTVEQEFSAAVRKAFPDALPPRPAATRPVEAVLKTDHDQATLLPPDAVDAVKLRKVDEQWKVDLNAMYADTVLDEIEQFRSALRDTEVSLAADIAAGKFKTYAEVQNELETRVKMHLATPGSGAATKPAL